MKTKTQMKNRLAITFALILCFASLTFAKGPAQRPAIVNPGPLPPTREVNLVIDDTAFSIDRIIEPLEYIVSFIL